MPRNPKPHSKTPRELDWIRKLASPYLNGYRPLTAHEDGLEGYWFVVEAADAALRRGDSPAPTKLYARAGFFVGYLVESAGKYSFLRPELPECLIFAWVSPASGALHERLVSQQGSLLRTTFEYIRWLTHRPPRFVFHEGEAAAMARHASMKDWPAAKRAHLSRNFFIETLAWLVRSGLVRKLREDAG